MVSSTGWFGSPSIRGKRARFSKVHFVRNGRPICGARLADDMEYQWCSHGANWRYVECKTCKRIESK